MFDNSISHKIEDCNPPPQFFCAAPRSRRRMTFPAGKPNDTEWCEPVANGEYAKLN